MGDKRVVITGLGIISGAGNSLSDFWDNIIYARSGIDEFPFATEHEIRYKKTAFIKNYKASDYLDGRLPKLLDACTQYALIAANEAIGHSRLEFTEELKFQSGVVTGTCIGGQEAQDKGFKELYKHGKKSIHPFTVPWTMPNAGASQISIEHGIKGPTFTTSTACSSSNHAIGQAFGLVRSGVCKVCITGGCETPLSYGFMKAWEGLRVVSHDTCRPFSKDRSGLILGEGAGMLVLEDLDHAIERGATILAEIIGFGMTADASHLTTPDPDGAVRAMRMALNDAKLEPHQIDYINAHGTGTMANDQNETKAVKTLFGEHAYNLAMSSTKAVHGHALGATGSFEAIATIMGMHHNILPPTANFNEVDPLCDLDIVPNLSRSAQINYAMSNSLAFGGLNAMLIFKRWGSSLH